MKIFTIIYLKIIFALLVLVDAKTIVRDKNYWYKENSDAIRKRLVNFSLQAENLMKVKNVVLFVADGAGINTFTATRVYKGQKLGIAHPKLIWDEFPALALVKVRFSILSSGFEEIPL